MDHKHAIFLQGLLHCAICYPVFLYREINLTETQKREYSSLKDDFKHHKDSFIYFFLEGAQT